MRPSRRVTVHNTFAKDALVLAIYRSVSSSETANAALAKDVKLDTDEAVIVPRGDTIDEPTRLK